MDSLELIEATKSGRTSGLHARISHFLALVASLLVLGCGAGQDSQSFVLAVAPSPLSIEPGGPVQTLTIGISPTHGFSGTVSVVIASLPAGVSAFPSNFLLPAGTLKQVAVSASAGAIPGNAAIAFVATSGAISRNTAFPVVISSPSPGLTSASLSNSTFNFGNNLINHTIAQVVATVTNTGYSPLLMNPTLTGDTSYSIIAAQSCGASLAPSASCEMVVNYDPKVPSAPGSQNATLNLGLGNVTLATPQTVTMTGISAALTPGVVTTTDNPQVALYTMTLPFPGSVVVNFGPTSDYGFSTWTRSTESPGGQISIFVAGMKSQTLYHMAATVEFSNGLTATDQDHTFTTGTIPASANLNLTVATPTGIEPSPGLEMVNTLSSLVVTDLAGNILWTYVDPEPISSYMIDGVKMLRNGNILMVIAPGSSAPLAGPQPPNAVAEAREVNLAGDTVREISIADLNAELQYAACAECNVTLGTFHHDVTPLPNGHWLVLANTSVALSSTSTPPLTNEPAQTVLGDVIVDLNQNLQPVWVWNEFNHLDPNRHPMSFPDWTHTNAIVYSPDDGNILVSIRHQNWVIKVDYANGSGTGDILWKLGEGGDFTLQGGTDPTDWQYAQHGPSFFSPNTTGVFSLGLMDNGDDRIFPAGVTCGASGAPPCLYSTVPVFQIDESAKTATLVFHQILPASQYNSWGGNAEKLANGDVEYDLSGLGSSSIVNEVTPDSSPQTVWSMTISGTNAYRAFRIPSLYPGVQW